MRPSRTEAWLRPGRQSDADEQDELQSDMKPKLDTLHRVKKMQSIVQVEPLTRYTVQGHSAPPRPLEHAAKADAFLSTNERELGSALSTNPAFDHQKTMSIIPHSRSVSSVNSEEFHSHRLSRTHDEACVPLLDMRCAPPTRVMTLLQASETTTGQGTQAIAAGRLHSVITPPASHGSAFLGSVTSVERVRSHSCVDSSPSQAVRPVFFGRSMEIASSRALPQPSLAVRRSLPVASLHKKSTIEPTKGKTEPSCLFSALGSQAGISRPSNGSAIESSSSRQSSLLRRLRSASPAGTIKLAYQARNSWPNTVHTRQSHLTTPRKRASQAPIDVPVAQNPTSQAAEAASAAAGCPFPEPKKKSVSSCSSLLILPRGGVEKDWITELGGNCFETLTLDTTRNSEKREASPSSPAATVDLEQSISAAHASNHLRTSMPLSPVTGPTPIPHPPLTASNSPGPERKGPYLAWQARSRIGVSLRVRDRQPHARASVIPHALGSAAVANENAASPISSVSASAQSFDFAKSGDFSHEDLFKDEHGLLERASRMCKEPEERTTDLASVLDVHEALISSKLESSPKSATQMTEVASILAGRQQPERMSALQLDTSMVALRTRPVTGPATLASTYVALRRGGHISASHRPTSDVNNLLCQPTPKAGSSRIRHPYCPSEETLFEEPTPPPTFVLPVRPSSSDTLACVRVFESEIRPKPHQPQNSPDATFLSLHHDSAVDEDDLVTFTHLTCSTVAVEEPQRS